MDDHNDLLIVFTINFIFLLFFPMCNANQLMLRLRINVNKATMFFSHHKQKTQNQAIYAPKLDVRAGRRDYLFILINSWDKVVKTANMLTNTD